MRAVSTLILCVALTPAAAQGQRREAGSRTEARRDTEGERLASDPVGSGADSGSGAGSDSGSGSGAGAGSGSGSGSDSGSGAGSGAEREAGLRFEAGRLAREQGRFEEALRDFRRAHELAPSEAHLWAVAQTLDALRRDAELIEVYRRYLELAPRSPRAAEVRARLAILRRGASVHGPGGASRPAPTEADSGDRSELARSLEREDAASEDAPGAQEWSVLDEPWFWAVVAVVVGGGLAAALLLSSGDSVQSPVPGSDGVVVRTLVEVP